MSSSMLRLLIVDDEEEVRINLVAFFKDEGFIVRSYTNGEDALTSIEQEDADFGIIDMRLTGMDGNELIINAHKLCPKMKFIIYTGSVSYTIPESLNKIGIKSEHVFNKPVKDMNILAKAIYSLTKKEK